jgi:putative hydrolase of HD superfamily
MNDIFGFRIINKLKSVYRWNSVDKRRESSAEHSWGCLMLADYFFDSFTHKMDKLKVYELLIYHDLVEIESGDSVLHPDMQHHNKKEKEFLAAKKLKEKLPKQLQEKFWTFFTEFEEQKTTEAKFARAIDALEAEIHELDYKEDWKDWTEEFLRSSKEKYFKDFPELKNAFEEITTFVRKNNYFKQ